MEENNINQNTEKEQIAENKHTCTKECIGMLIAAFLGGFLAIYFVADQVFARTSNYNDNAENQIIQDFNRSFERERKAFERDFKKIEKELNKNQAKFNDKWFQQEKQATKLLSDGALSLDMTTNGVKVESEIDDNKYKVEVCLKAFNGDESKINYNVSGRKLTVFGKSQVKDKNFEQNISFSNDFLLPKNADIANITKRKDDNKLIIEVPLK